MHKPETRRSLRVPCSFQVVHAAVVVLVFSLLFGGCQGDGSGYAAGDPTNTLGGPAYTTGDASIKIAEPDPSSTLTGRVYDKTSSADLAGATVRINASSNTAASSAIGAYVLTGLPAGTFRIEVSKSGYYTHVQSVSLAIRGTLRLDVGLVPTNTTGGLSGTVINAQTDAVLEGVRVVVPEQAAVVPLPPGANTSPVAEATTDRLGRFTLNSLPAGALTVQFRHPKYRSTDALVDIKPSLVSTQTFRLLFSTGQVEGTIQSTRASNPLTAAQVSVLGTLVTSVTDTAGRYALEALTPGTLILELTAAGHDRTVVTTSIVTGKTTTTNVSMRYCLTAVFGTVHDTNDVPIANATVSVPALALTTKTNRSGEYDFGFTVRIANPATSLTVAVDAQGYATQGAVLSLTPGQRVRQDFSMYTMTGNLVGAVLSATSTLPVSGASVVLPALNQRRVSDSTGAFNFFAIPPTLYQMNVQSQGYSTVTTYVPVLAGQTSRVTVTLRL